MVATVTDGTAGLAARAHRAEGLDFEDQAQIGGIRCAAPRRARVLRPRCTWI